MQAKSFARLSAVIATALTPPLISIAVTATTTVAVTPANGGPVAGTSVVVDNSYGDQTDPHIDGDLASYTDIGSGVIRLYDFQASMPGVVPNVPGDIDVLSDVSGHRISFSRHRNNSRSVMVYDTQTASVVEIGTGSGLNPFLTSIGGDTVAFVNLISAFGGLSDIRIGSVSAPSAPLAALGNPAEENTMPSVSPDGLTVVWMRCDVPSINCGILKSTYSGAWSAASVFSDSPSNEFDPSTDGQFVVYTADRPGSSGGTDIYYQPLAGGVETQLQIAGYQRNPHISQGVISFESWPGAGSVSDVFVYVIATNTLYQVTNTPVVDDLLSDMTILPNGDVRIIWAAGDDVAGWNNIYAVTFSLPGTGDTTAPTISISTPATGATYVKGQTVAAAYSCQDEPGGSGLASCLGPVANGAPLDTSTVGTHSFTVTSTDIAGNLASTTHTYRVLYNFGGFSQPIENLPTLNVVTAGSSVAVKFSLGGNQGLGLFAAGYPASTPITCDATEPGVEIEETVTAGNSSLSYSSTTAQYTYIWKTEKSWKDTCRMLVIRFDDSAEYLAKFRFR